MKRMIEPGCLQLAVLASGRGSNFLAIQNAIDKGQLNARVCIVISDKEKAPVLQRAQEAGIATCFVDPKQYPDREAYESEIVKQLQALNIDLVVLAGYMRLVGKVLLEAFSLKMINIHPALLPSFTGLHAQRQAVDYGVKFSGCTVHFVDAGMDTGPIIVQSVVPVNADDTEETLSARILAEEHKIYPQAIQWISEGRVYINGRKVMLAN